jgi:hypothetical protein
VLDLLAGVTRTIAAESSGYRTPAFGAWWEGVDRSAQQTIQEMRNAELKELVSRTAAQIEVGSQRAGSLLRLTAYTAAAGCHGDPDWARTSRAKETIGSTL